MPNIKKNGAIANTLSLNDWLSLIDTRIYIVGLDGNGRGFIEIESLLVGHIIFDSTINRFGKNVLFIRDITNSHGGSYTPGDELIFFDKESAIAYFQVLVGVK